VTHRTQESTEFTTRPSRKKVVLLIESDMSTDGHRIDHNEKCGMTRDTVEEVLGLLFDKDNLINYQLVISYRLLIRVMGTWVGVG
jgi:hypothetical protein